MAWVKKPRRCVIKRDARAHAHARVRAPMPFMHHAVSHYHWSCNADNYIAKEHRMNPELSELAHLRTLRTVYAMMGMEVPEIERLTSLEAKYATKEKV